MIKVNDNAREQVQRLLAEEGRPEGSFVRVGVKGGGCSGLMYQLDFDHVMNDDDQAFEDNGVKVVPSYLLEPVAVTKDNITSVLVDSGYYTEDQLK